MDGGTTTHSYPRLTDPARKNSLPVLAVGTTSHTVTDATYAPATGVMTLTVANHNFTGASQHTVTDAAYTPTSGDMQLTIASHGFTNGDRIRLENDSLTFTCAKDNHGSTHSYPRATDPSSLKWLTIQEVTTNTFVVNIGKSQDTSAHRFISATSNGVQKAVDSVRMDADSIRFTCAKDGNLSLIHI